MKISASVKNTSGDHFTSVQTGDTTIQLTIAPKKNGRGSSVNGGELLFLSLASCYCNDIFREAGEMGIEVNSIEVNVEGEFGGKGEPATKIIYDVKISADATEDRITELLQYTDTVAEIQNTLRMAVPVRLRRTEIV
jgi:uncharacterized OsmC-like protein